MDTNRIRYFLSLAKTGSVTKAANLHHISPPALSKAMKVFEAELREKLIVPEGRGILLTDRARVLVPALEEVVRKLDAVLSKAAREDEASDQALRIATFEVFSTHFMERMIRDSFPDRTLLLHEMIPGRMENAVANREVDLALTYLPIPHPDLDHLKVRRIEMGIYGLKGKFTAASRTLPFVVPVAPIEGSPNKVRGLDGWPDDAFPRQVRYRVGMLETALGIVRRGLAVAYIPNFIATLHNEIVRPEYALEARPLPNGFTIAKTHVYLIKRKTGVEGADAKRVGTALRKFCV